MSSAKLTLIGLENYLSNFNESLFKSLQLPSGIDKETLVNNILIKSGEFEVLYSDPVFMQNAINHWGKKYYRTFDKWVKALNIDYNPLENYDRIEDITRENTGTVKNTGTESNVAKSVEKINNNTTDKVSAYNSDTMRNNTTEDVNGTDEVNNSGTRTDNLTRTDDLKEITRARLHGNIGVTTSQQMLQSELDIAAWSLYDNITDLFTTEFCIMVY